MLTIKHLHLVPPGFFASFYPGPVFKYVLDHGCRHWTIMLGKHMETYFGSKMPVYHAVEFFHVLPGIEIAVDHACAIYGGMICFAQLFFHWDIYRVMYADKYPYENYRSCYRRI